MSGAAIACAAVEKRYGRTAALAGIDLEVAAGATLAVLGPNGAGKSTLLRLVAGLGRPTGGSLSVGGERADRAAARRRVGFIGHQTLLYPELTARENLIFAGRLHRVAQRRERADALLEEEGLAGVADRRAGDFSRGMAQRLAIARALVHDPDVVLLDEPFTGLDRRAADRLSERLGRLHGEERTLLLVTHEVSRALELASSAVVLGAGRILHAQAGPLDAAALERAYLDA